MATILSAQCTDVRVNQVTAELFRRFRTPEDYLALTEQELEELIRPTGFFRQKTRSIRGCCAAHPGAVRRRGAAHPRPSS